MNRIYIACLASYNNGVLHGKWIDASTDVEAMQEEVNAVLRASKFPNVRVAKDEESKERVAELAAIIRQVPDVAQNVFEAAYAQHLALTVPSAEEYAIHDFEGEALKGLGEYCGLQAVADRVELEEVAEHELGDDGLEIVMAYWDHMGVSCMPKDAHDAVEAARETYQGTFDSWEAWAEDYVESTGLLHDVPENLRNYFDYEAFGRDASYGDMFESEGHYFSAR